MARANESFFDRRDVRTGVYNAVLTPDVEIDVDDPGAVDFRPTPNVEIGDPRTVRRRPGQPRPSRRWKLDEESPPVASWRQEPGVGDLASPPDRASPSAHPCDFGDSRLPFDGRWACAWVRSDSLTVFSKAFQTFSQVEQLDRRSTPILGSSMEPCSSLGEHQLVIIASGKLHVFSNPPLMLAEHRWNILVFRCPPRHCDYTENRLVLKLIPYVCPFAKL